MKVKRQLRMLLDRIDGELAELRDGLIEVDHKAGEAHHAYRMRDQRMMQQAEDVQALRERVDALERTVALDHGDHSRRV